MPEPRIVPPGEARHLYDAADTAMDVWDKSPQKLAAAAFDLAHTAAVLGEQREAALTLHPNVQGYCPICQTRFQVYPCPTARALGVTDA